MRALPLYATSITHYRLMSGGRAMPEALGEFRNDFGAIDGDGMWRYKINGSSGRWIRDRQRVRGLISLGQRKPDKPTTSCAWEERQETWSSVQEPKMSTVCQHRRRTRSGVTHAWWTACKPWSRAIGGGVRGDP